MVEDKDLVPRKQGEIVERQISLDELPREIERDDISWLDKRQLVKNHVRALIKRRQMNIDTTLDVERQKLILEKDIFLRRLDLYQEQLSLQVQEEFIGVFKQLGVKVSEDAFNFMKDFSKLLSDQMDEIQKMENIDVRSRDAIIKRIEKRFDNVNDSLYRITDKLLKEIEERKIKYDVALSFAGEDRSIAREINESLKKENIKVFFDEHSSTELWGRNLYNLLEKIYTESKLCIVIVSKNYSEKQWTRLEFRNLIAHASSRPSFSLLPIHIGDAPLPRDLANVAYVQWDSVSSQELTQIVKDRLSSLAPPGHETVQKNIHVIKREAGWSVKREGASRAASVHKTREEAITNARKLAQRSDKSNVVVHSEDGSIESQQQVSKE